MLSLKEGGIMNKYNISCDHILDDLKTFDIILMHGTMIGSRLIELIEFNKWSHVAMVVRGEDIGLHDDKHPVLLWESTDYTNLKDRTIKKEGQTGPMLVGLCERIRVSSKNKTNSLTAVRYLNVERTPEMFEILKKTISEVHSLEMPTPGRLFKEIVKGRYLNKRIKKHTLFCSELMIYTYQRIGLMHKDLITNKYEPKDFCSSGYIPLLKRATLSNEIFIGPNKDKSSD